MALLAPSLELDVSAINGNCFVLLCNITYLFLANPDGSDYQYEIVFDEAFAGGHTWRCGAGKGYCLSTASFVNISHGNRQEERKKGGRLSLPANFMPQGTTYSADQVDYRYYSPKANSKTVQKLEKIPKQSHAKKSAKQSYDKVEVRLLKRPTDNKSMHQICEYKHCSI